VNFHWGDVIPAGDVVRPFNQAYDVGGGEARMPPTIRRRKTVDELVEEADDKLFTNEMYNKQHWFSVLQI